MADAKNQQQAAPSSGAKYIWCAPARKSVVNPLTGGKMRPKLGDVVEVAAKPGSKRRAFQIVALSEGKTVTNDETGEKRVIPGHDGPEKVGDVVYLNPKDLVAVK